MDVVFAVMPFADVGRPAIGVSLLKAAIGRSGFSATIEYFGLRLAELIGVELYQKISSAFAPDLLVGEWFFADDLFGDAIPHEDDYFGRILSAFAGPDTVAALKRARRHRAGFLDEAARRILALAPRVVGFTTTFHQSCASLAVARRIKAAANPPIVVFGGANCEGEMGLQLLESFPCIDYVCSGEADLSFPELVADLLGGRRGRGLPGGVLGRGRGGLPARSPAIPELNALPYPDYDDYFEQIERTPLGEDAAGYLVVETSRGCWWGAKHHCTFCGLNGETMAFRSKSPARALAEITDLAHKYGRTRIGCVDNILDLQYVDTLFPQLAARGLGLELFYEVKSNLRLDQLRTMYAGGLRQIQPGIESLSNQVLGLMDKGVTALQNIQLMRWCAELGIECAWNLLAGFPGELPAEYARMAEVMPLLTHLPPPSSCAQVRLDRFSPFYTRSEVLGFRRVRPARAYFYVFPFGRAELNRLAYFFDFDYAEERDFLAYLAPVQAAVQAWWDAHLAGAGAPRLEARRIPGGFAVTDTRPIAGVPSREVTGLDAEVLHQCDTARTLPALLRHVLRPPTLAAGEADSEADVRAALSSLAAAKLLIVDDGHFLALPIFKDRTTDSAGERLHGISSSTTTAVADALSPAG